VSHGRLAAQHSELAGGVSVQAGGVSPLTLSISGRVLRFVMKGGVAVKNDVKDDKKSGLAM